MISVPGVSMRFGSKVLLEDVTTKGVVLRPDKLGVLSQDQFAFDACRVVDTVRRRTGPGASG